MPLSQFDVWGKGEIKLTVVFCNNVFLFSSFNFLSFFELFNLLSSVSSLSLHVIVYKPKYRVRFLSVITAHRM